MNRFAIALGIALVLAPAIARAHVTIWPRESAPGVSERYTVRVPTEGKMATTSVKLIVPNDVTVTSVMAMPGVAADITREGNRNTVFLARNPKQGAEITWKVHQYYADGTQSDWTGPPSKGPAPTTKLVAR